MGPFDGAKKSTLSVSLEWVSQVAEEFEESEFEIQTSELGEDGRKEGDMWSSPPRGGRLRCFL